MQGSRTDTRVNAAHCHSGMPLAGIHCSLLRRFSTHSTIGHVSGMTILYINMYGSRADKRVNAAHCHSVMPLAGIHCLAATLSTHPHDVHVQQISQLLNPIRNVTHTHRTVMRRPVPIPGLYKSACTERKPIPAVCIAYLQNRPRFRHGLCH